MPGYQTKEVFQRLRITYTGEVVPIPVALDPVPAGATPAASPTPVAGPAAAAEDTDIRATIGTSDGRRRNTIHGDSCDTAYWYQRSPRTFDELALLLPGVAPPQTLGSVAGPGVGAGVGSAGICRKRNAIERK